MRVALTYNQKRSDDESHAEFDRPETIRTIAGYVEASGHRVTPIDVTGSIPRLVGRLREVAPDLVLNLAEGERGTFREAFYPALFEQLGYAHTGSSASALAICLDKALAKKLVAAAGIRVPIGELVRAGDPIPRVPLPAIAKPNFEGSSKGITSSSIATNERELRAAIDELLPRYPSILVEEYVAGVDVAVGWITGLGVLPVIAYRYPARGAFPIYDYTLKHRETSLVTIEIPAKLDEAVVARLGAITETVFEVLGVEGYGRADYRIAPDGDIVFLEMNPLPSLAPGDVDLYGACARIGVSPQEMFEWILQKPRPHENKNRLS